MFGLKPMCTRTSSYRGDKRGVRHLGVADAPSPKKPGVDGDAILELYAPVEQLQHGLLLHKR
jgi:hypothetical protein